MSLKFHEISLCLQILDINDIRKFIKRLSLQRSEKRIKKLSKEEKERNQEIAKQRIVVAHVFASIKRFKIIGSLYRDNLKKLSKIINIIAGIHNLNIK